MQIQSKYDVVVVGGGVYGLSIAYYLAKNQDLKIAVLQQYAIGHNKGSSHSATRITRSLYEKQVYRDLNVECLNKNWPQLEKTLASKFIHPNEFVYFSDELQSYNSFRKVAEQSPSQTVKICQTHKEYEMYFKGRKAPLINSKFPPIIDKKAGIIYASQYISKLKQFLQTQCENVAVMEHTTVKSIRENEKELSVETQTEILRANKVVLACGKWIKQLAPQTFDLFHVVKQFVGFLQLEPQSLYQVGNYPSFAHNTKDNHLYYSAPCDMHQKLGLKLAQHRFSQPLNPDAVENSVDYHYEKLREKAMEYFGQDLVRVKTVEECIYTNTKSNDFIIDWVGESERILICSCCSGHGFKFAPIIGQIIAEIVTNSNQQGEKSEAPSSNSTYNKHAHTFKMAYHRGIDLS